MSDEIKICEGCKKDLSNGGGFKDGTVRVGFQRPLWRCAECKIAKTTKHLARLEAAANEAISVISRAGPRDLPSDDAAEAYRLLTEAMTENQGPLV